MEIKLRNTLIAEFFGTFALVFIGCGAIVAEQLYPGRLGHLGISLAFGLAVLIVIYSVGNISGAHINPAVTFGFFISKKIKFSKFLQYSTAQIGGGIFGAFLLYILHPGVKDFGITSTGNPDWQVILAEVVFSFILMVVILNIATGHMEKGIMAGVAVGGTVLVLALIGGPVSGASMNPARSLGPAVFTPGGFQNLWIYLTAPFLGTFLASPMCRLIQGPICCPAPNPEENQ
jgi:aquaporin Z